MATFVAIRNKKQTVGALAGVLKYVAQERKTRQGDLKFVSGYNCVPQCAYIEMLTTKRQFRKTDGRQFYHFVQSFSDDDFLTPQEANAIGLEFAEREFSDFEVMIATHLDTGHLHNHLVVNSVSCVDGRKLHQNAADLQAHRNANDLICQRHGLSVLKKAIRHESKKSIKPGEYQAGLRGENWKLDLLLAINEALEYADDRESFIENMEQEGYQVLWTDTRNHITFITPEGQRCRDSSLHDETFHKQNLEMLFLYRQAFGFSPATEEPEEGWLGELAEDAVRFGRYLEQAFDTPDLPPIPTWSESKQRSREALKKLAHGQKLTNEESYGYDFGW